MDPIEYAIFQDSMNVAMQGDCMMAYSQFLYSHIGAFTADTVSCILME